MPAYFGLASISTIISVVATQPFDVIKTKLQTQNYINSQDWNPCRQCKESIEILSEQENKLNKLDDTFYKRFKLKLLKNKINKMQKIDEILQKQDEKKTNKFNSRGMSTINNSDRVN